MAAIVGRRGIITINSGLAIEAKDAIKLITFDVTGTLLKFRKSPVTFYTEFGLKYGVIVDNAKLQDSFKKQWKRMNSEQPNYGTCWRRWWTEFVVQTFRGRGVSENSVNENTLITIAAELIEHFTTSACWEVKDGVRDLLTSIKNRRQSTPPQLGVISNFDSRLKQILIETKIHDYFDFILTSHECQAGKPDPCIFEMALSHGNFRSVEAVHIGDNYQLDFKGAMGSGWNGLLVIPPGEVGNQEIPPNILSAQPQIVYSDLKKLREYLVGQ